jgi:hypothetical protein
MLTFMRSRPRTRGALAALSVVAGGLLATACGGSTSSGTPATTHEMTPATSTSNPAEGAGHDGMPGMDMAMPSGDGLAVESSGFRLASSAPSLPSGQPTSFQFRITDTAGNPVTVFEPDQTKLMHFYLVRSDLTGFQHVHPTTGGDGTWSAPLPALDPGTYRAFASFITRDPTGKTVPLVLSQPLTVPGNAQTAPLPSASTTTQVDGYTLTLASDRLMSGMRHDLEVTVTKDGKPVTDLQPYLDTYAHLTAFRQDDLAFAHLHPHGQLNGDHGGPALSFEAALPKAGSWRLFLQFQTGGVLHTAAVTVAVS